LSCPSYLLIAYNLLKKSKDGSGVDSVNVTGVTLPAIINLSNSLSAGNYKPKPTKRLFIKKSNGKMRPLGIASALDKVVQKAILLLIEPIFEKVFLDCSHGFRKNRSCHSALSNMYHSWRGVRWFIECDFVGCFDKISHPILLEIFNKYINDRLLSMLLLRFLKAGYIDFSNLNNSKLNSDEGVPQGAFLSPLLCNILLHKFDLDILQIINNYPKYDPKKTLYLKGIKLADGLPTRREREFTKT